MEKINQLKIEKLISELCPNGVEFLDIERLWIKAPKSKLGVAQVKELSEGNIICFTSGKNVFYVDDYLVDGEYIFMNDGGSADTKYNKGKAYYTDHTFTFTVNENKLLPKFIYYFLKENEIYINDILFKGTGLKNLNKKAFAKFKIPVPPLAIQEEIVKILDNFTELEAELEARKKQYEYYYKKILKASENVRQITLDEVGRISMCKRIFKNETSATGDIPFYKIGTFGKQPDAFISQNVYDEYRKKFSFPKKGDVLLSASGTIGRRVIYNGEPAYFQDSNIIWIDNDESKILNKFLYYMYATVEWKTEGGTIKRLYNGNVKKIRIPVPALDEQQRIVSILDKFDALVNDISIGLPAELKARRQQYEYYRNKLLTFKEYVG
ncbi:MAG: putative type-1 restriction enzyme specificity protein [Parcubacteria group bacterium ADurb.Bin016]|nr:MAG: putative type-1 restriction enzyme specificity protein [Parcubacteria group bacterium ADurb.Bin016]